MESELNHAVSKTEESLVFALSDAAQLKNEYGVKPFTPATLRVVWTITDPASALLEDDELHTIDARKQVLIRLRVIAEGHPRRKDGSLAKTTVHAKWHLSSTPTSTRVMVPMPGELARVVLTHLPPQVEYPKAVHKYASSVILELLRQGATND